MGQKLRVSGFSGSSWGRWQTLVYLLFVAGTAVSLTACFGGGGEDTTEQPAAEGAPDGAAAAQMILACTDECAQQGQCGTAVNGGPLILGRNDRPETRDHNLLFNADLSVSILESREQMIQSPDGQLYSQPFSLVILNDNGQQGWVANWCIAQAPAQ